MMTLKNPFRKADKAVVGTTRTAVMNLVDAEEVARLASTRTDAYMGVTQAQATNTQSVQRTTLSGDSIDVSVNDYLQYGYRVYPVVDIHNSKVLAVYHKGKRIK